MPQIERVYRLHIKMTIDQNGGLITARVQPIGIDHWLCVGFDNLDVLQPRLAHIFCQPLGCCQDILFVGREGADAGDTQPLL
jgi:hypothetical protein